MQSARKEYAYKETLLTPLASTLTFPQQRRSVFRSHIFNPDSIDEETRACKRLLLKNQG